MLAQLVPLGLDCPLPVAAWRQVQ